MEAQKPVSRLSWGQYLFVGVAMLIVGFSITNTYADTSVMWNVGAGVQLVGWGFFITGVVRGVKGRTK